MNENSLPPTIDPELEVRIVAMVLGEASDFERDQLQQLIDQQPELAAFQAEIQAVHAQLQGLVSGEAAESDGDWKLADSKRQNLLATIGDGAQPSAAKAAQHSSPAVTRRPGWSQKKVAVVVGTLTTVAAVVLMIGLLFPPINMARMSSRSSSERTPAGWEDSYDQTSPPSGAAYFDMDMDVAASSSAHEMEDLSVMDAEADFGYQQGPQATSEALRGLLGQDGTQPHDDYLADDVQLAPATPQLALPQEAARKSRTRGEAAQNGASIDRLGALPPITEPKALEGSEQTAPGGAGRYGVARDKAEGFSSGFGGAGMAPMADAVTAPAATEHFNRQELAANELDRVSDLSKKNAPMSGKDFSGSGDSSPDDNGLEYDFRAENAPESVRNLNSSRADDRRYEGKPQTTARPERLLEELQKQMPQQAAEPDMAGVNLQKEVEEEYARPVQPAATALKETAAADEAFSTFSLHVSDVSFKLAYAALAVGEAPEPAKIRIEEFVNAFDYGDPMPSQSEKVACRVEQAIHPFLQQRNLMRVSMRTAAAGRASTTPLRLTLLLDNSGSMERIDRQQTVRRAVALLAEQLTPADRVTLISFARQPRLLADGVPGEQAQQLVQRIDSLPSEGGTNIEAALQLAFEKAKEQQTDGAQNRIVLLTDGAVNLGDANPDRLSQMITTMRDAGIAFDAAGISAEGLNDEILEALTRKGDGRYYLLDTFESADDGFARQLAGALRPAAKNVKVQIEFNPRRVGNYKLLGFEKHLLNKEDFRNDAVDAAEMAAAEAGVAVYQFEAKPDGEGDVGSVSVRFRDLSTGQMVENRWPIPYVADAPRIDQAAPSLQIATSAAMLAAKLRGEPLGETVDLKALSKWIAELPERQRNTQRIQQLRQMIEQARSLGF